MFNLDFERAVLKLYATNLQFFNDFFSILKANHFDSRYLGLLFDAISSYIKRYNRTVDRTTLELLAEEIIQKKGYDTQTYQILNEESKTIFRQDISAEEFISDKALQFIKRKELGTAIEQSIEIIQKDWDYNNITQLINKAMSVDKGQEDDLCFTDLENFPLLYRKKYDPNLLIKTGFSKFDYACLGGMAPGEVSCIIAPPKKGKTTLGVNIGVHNLLADEPVFHVSLEAEKEDIMSKYACCFTGLTYRELLTIDIEIYKQKMEKFKKLQPNLFVKKWDEGTITTLNIRSWVLKKRLLNQIPDTKTGLLIIDYDSCLLPTKTNSSKGSNDMYSDGGQIYVDMIQLASFLKMPILTFSQPQREGMKMYENMGCLLTTDKIGESAKKLHKAWRVASLNFKDEGDEGILYLELNRRGASNIRIPIEKKLDRGFMGEIKNEE